LWAKRKPDNGIHSTNVNKCRPPTVKIFLRTPKIFKFKDILKDRVTSTQAYNYWL